MNSAEQAKISPSSITQISIQKTLLQKVFIVFVIMMCETCHNAQVYSYMHYLATNNAAYKPEARHSKVENM